MRYLIVFVVLTFVLPSFAKMGSANCAYGKRGSHNNVNERSYDRILVALDEQRSKQQSGSKKKGKSRSKGSR